MKPETKEFLEKQSKKLKPRKWKQIEKDKHSEEVKKFLKGGSNE